MSTITSITASEITDSRNRPALLVEVSAGEATGRCAVPSGASTGIHEALERRDSDGHLSGVIDSVKGEIAKTLLGREVADQGGLDRALIELDGTPQKSRLGGNALIGVSIATARAAASERNEPFWAYLRELSNQSAHLGHPEESRRMPYLLVNLINGGSHANSAIAFQEYQIIPQTREIAEALKIARAVEEGLARRPEFAPERGDEGGFVCREESAVEAPLRILSEVLAEKGLSDAVWLSLDVAASSFWNEEKSGYEVAGRVLSGQELLALYHSLIERYGLRIVEDPFQEEEFGLFRELTEDLDPAECMVLGDDLTVTNPDRIARALDEGSITAAIIKPNQVGTLSETIAAVAALRSAGLEAIASHRSGETDDDFIADLAVGLSCWGIKAGALSQPERAVKYRRLQEIASL